MANFNIRMDLQGDLLKSMKAVSAQMKGMKKQTKSIGNSWKNVTKGILGANVATRIVGNLREVTKTFDDTQKTYQAFSDRTGTTLAQFQKQVASTSMLTGESMAEVNNTLSSIATKTGDINFARGIISRLSELQVASGATGEDLGNVASMFKNQGVAAQEGSKYLDVFYSIGKHGSFTMKEMARYGTKAFTSMSLYNGSLDEGKVKDFAIASQMVERVTGDAAETSTALYQAYNRIRMKPAQEMLKKYGVSMKDSMGHARNLMDVMIDLSKHGMSLDDAKKAFGERGKKVYDAALVKTNVALKNELEAMQTYNDLHKDAVANTKTFQASLNRLSAAFSGVLLPALQPVVSLMADFFSSPDFNLDKIAFYAKGVVSLGVAFKGLSMAMAAAGVASGPLALFIAGVGAAAIAAGILGKKTKEWLDDLSSYDTESANGKSNIHLHTNLSVDSNGSASQETRVKRKNGFGHVKQTSYLGQTSHGHAAVM